MPSSVTSWGDYRVAALQPYMALVSSSGDFLQRCFFLPYVITTSSYSSFWERMTLLSYGAFSYSSCWERMTLFSYGAYLLLSRLCLCTFRLSMCPYSILPSLFVRF